MEQDYEGAKAADTAAQPSRWTLQRHSTGVMLWVPNPELLPRERPQRAYPRPGRDGFDQMPFRYRIRARLTAWLEGVAKKIRPWPVMELFTDPDGE